MDINCRCLRENDYSPGLVSFVIECIELDVIGQANGEIILIRVFDFAIIKYGLTVFQIIN